MIRSSSLATIAERSTVVKKQEVKVQAQPVTICKDCGIDKNLTRGGVCSTCRQYKRTHGKARSADLIERLETRRHGVRWCRTCGSTDLFIEQRCRPCYRYWKLYNKERPRRKWDKDFCCVVCGFPRKAAMIQKRGRANFYKDKCLACYNYEKRLSKPRPEYLWGKGSKGWCDCGYGAEHQIDGLKMCNRCVKDYR